MTESIADLVQVVAHEREGRDRGWWDQMAGCYHSDSRVRSMWFTGTGRDFANASRAMAARGDRSRHRLSVPAVHVCGERAIVSMPMAIEFRIELHGVEADLISYARGIYRLERRDSRYKICDLSTIYERDTLTPVTPGEPIPLDRQRLAQQPGELPDAGVLLHVTPLRRRPEHARRRSAGIGRPRARRGIRMAQQVEMRRTPRRLLKGNPS